MYLPRPDEGGEFEMPPAGTHLATCYRVIDLGTQQGEYMGKPKIQRKIMLSWELPDEQMEDGRNFTVHHKYTFSTYENAKLRQHLEAWRGKAFQEADFGPGGFDIKNVLGTSCLLGILHEPKNGKAYANISSVGKLPKGMEAKPGVNAKVYFTLSSEEWGANMQTVFEGLSNGLKAQIIKSPEYAELTKQANGQSAPPAPTRGGGGDLDDDIPF